MDSRRSSISTYSTEVVSYIQIRVLGKGAHGRAVLYRNATDDSLVVWKEITIERNTAAEVQKEIDILSMLDHPNIVTYYNHFVSCDTIFIEMEYANGGSLAKFLKERQVDLPDGEVRWYIFQILYGVEYIHKCQVIHRDLKSLNIFMSSSALIKIGDFGISKVLSEDEMAKTRVGTPVYMSPEVIQGHLYSTKSDIWSCGCILFEIMTRKKLVKCSNELGIAMKIVNRDFEKPPMDADPQLIDLLNRLLKHDPVHRPTATEVLQDSLWNNEQGNMIARIQKCIQSNNSPRPCSGDRRERSVVSLKTDVFVWGGGKKYPVKLEEFTQQERALQVSVGPSHFAVVTVEKNLYTWSTNQGDIKAIDHLGHGKNAYKTPRIVSSMKGINIKDVACGAESTVCVSTNGEVFSCGSNYYGQLGIGTSTIQSRDNFGKIDIVHPKTRETMFARCISSGHYHVAAIAADDDCLFTWGCGEYGRLGHGSEDNHLSPTLVDLPASKLKLVECGPDCSFIVLKSNDRILACGNNKFNKLGINLSAKGLLGSSKAEFSYDVPFETKFKPARFLRYIAVKHISCGKNHTTIVDEYNKMYVFGCNKYGQLGLGDLKSHPGINVASKIFAGKQVDLVSCGDNYTFATTIDNEIYGWGFAENGRLGMEMSGEARYICHPRALFGCLYKCASIRTSGWQTIMVTERVLETNTIAASSCHSQLSDIVNTDTGHGSGTLSSDVSPWLPSELDNGEIIPLEAVASHEHSTASKGSSSMTRTSELAPWLQAELNEAEYIPMGSTMFNNNIDTKYPNFERYKCDCGCQNCMVYIRELEDKLTMLETRK